MHLLMATLLTSALGSASVLRAEKPYCTPGGAVRVMVDVPRDADVELALMDADGRLLAPIQPAARGWVNLAQLMPGVWELDRAAYLQCMIGGDPFDSALVVQPMLSQEPPRTEVARRADGTPYTRVVGWGPGPGGTRDETPGETPQAGSDGTADDAPPAAGAEDPADSTAAAPAPIRSGLHVYPERDVLLRTSLGDIRLALRPDEAPNTAWNFRQLVDGGFYDGLTFHRIVPLTRNGDPFVIQGGDPTGDGEGGPGYRLPLEPSGLPHDFGVISMARADDPDSAGSQFFICLSREGTARLDGQYCAFGTAVDGEQTIESIAAVRLADVASGRPAEPPVIERARLLASPPRLPGAGRTDQPLSRRRRLQHTEPPPDRVPR